MDSLHLLKLNDNRQEIQGVQEQLDSAFQGHREGRGKCACWYERIIDKAQRTRRAKTQDHVVLWNRHTSLTTKHAGIPRLQLFDWLL